MSRATAAIFAIAALAACDRRKTEDERPAVRPTTPLVADARVAEPPPPDGPKEAAAAICDTARQLIDRSIVCVVPEAVPHLKKARAALERDIPAEWPLNEHEQLAVECAGFAKQLDDALEDADPVCRLTGDERARNTAFLDAYFARRTRPRPTGDATVDANLRELASARDRMCACVDEECVRATHAVVTDATKPVPRELTAAMEDAVAISDEVSRCAERVERNASLLRLRE